MVLTGGLDVSTPKSPPDVHVSLPVVIEDGALINARAIILPGITARRRGCRGRRAASSHETWSRARWCFAFRQGHPAVQVDLDRRDSLLAMSTHNTTSILYLVGGVDAGDQFIGRKIPLIADCWRRAGHPVRLLRSTELTAGTAAAAEQQGRRGLPPQVVSSIPNYGAACPQHFGAARHPQQRHLRGAAAPARRAGPRRD